MKPGKVGTGVLLAVVTAFGVLSLLSVLTGTFVLVGVALFFGAYVGVHWLLWGRFDQHSGL